MTRGVDDSYNISPSNLFHAIEIVIKASSSSNSSTQKITNDTVKNFREVKVDLQKSIPKKIISSLICNHIDFKFLHYPN